MFEDSPSYLNDGPSDELFPQTTTLGEAYGGAAPGTLTREDAKPFVPVSQQAAVAAAEQAKSVDTSPTTRSAKKEALALERAKQAAQAEAEARARQQRIAASGMSVVGGKAPTSAASQLPKQPPPPSYAPAPAAPPTAYIPPAAGGFVPSTASDAAAADAILATGVDLTGGLTEQRGIIASVPVWGWLLGGAVTIGVGYAGYRWWTRKPSRYRD